MSKVSVVIASRNEVYEVAPGMTVLYRTVQDMLAKATGEIEIIVAFDGPPYQRLPDDPRVIKLGLPQTGLKACVNAAARRATGPWLYNSDSHCMVSKGFDEELQYRAEPNWVITPRFYVLDAEHWRWQDDRYYDYFKLCCPLTDPKGYRFQAAGHWPERTRTHAHITPLDETMQMHGSGWLIGKEFYLKCLGGMSDEGYGNMFMIPPEICLKTWLGPWDGKVMVNKNCFYAHMHKGGQRPRGYGVSQTEIKRSYLWTANYWMRNQWAERAHDLDWLVKKFWPIPNWPDNWRELQTEYEMGQRVPA